MATTPKTSPHPYLRVVSFTMPRSTSSNSTSSYSSGRHPRPWDSNHPRPHGHAHRSHSRSSPQSGSQSSLTFVQSSTNGHDSDNSLASLESEVDESVQKCHHKYSEGTARKKLCRDPLACPARHFGHTVEMWHRFQTIIHDGMHAERDDEPEDPQQQLHKWQYNVLLAIIPSLPQEIEAQGLDHVATSMENARNCGRGEDIKHIKDLMQSLRNFTPALTTDDKESRGFKHPQIGCLLVSGHKVSEWDNDDDYHGRVKDGIVTFQASDYPVFLYEDDQVDPNDLLLGFLRSQILVCAYRAVMIGPSAINGKGPSARATKKGNAQLNNMTAISIPSISYIATLVHFSLSSQTTFHAGGEMGRFDYYGMYHSIINLLMHERMEAQCDALLSWWQGQIFPNVCITQEPEGDTALGHILAQLEASN